MKMSPAMKARFWRKVNTDGPMGINSQTGCEMGPCWVWTAALSQGYGMFGVRTGWAMQAHIVLYRSEVGEVPGGLELDHLCRNRACVRPSHLEAVTHQENSRRGLNRQAEKTHCPSGHPYSVENTYRPPGSPRERQCVTCRRERTREWRARKKATSINSNLKEELRVLGGGP